MVKYINEPCMFVVEIMLAVSRIILHSKQYILKLYKEVRYQVHSPHLIFLKTCKQETNCITETHFLDFYKKIDVCKVSTCMVTKPNILSMSEQYIQHADLVFRISIFM
jgi:hypothetical protein